MNDIVRVLRTCTEVSDTDHNQKNESRPLNALRSVPAYVLLGDPGAGKTTAFQVESEAMDDACPITARDFLTLNVDSHPEWREKTLFIDGLDEVRAGTADVRTPFDAIRRSLEALGKPRFRLSCREADWLGENDRKHLASVTPDGAVTVLRLDPLTEEDIITILNAQPGVDDAQEFVAKARERGVDGLLKNPQSLELLVKAVADGGWPESRLDTFEHACRQMVREPNDDHRAARRESLPDQILLNAAGRLCAVQLITGIAGYTVGLGEPDSAYPSPEECDGDIERGEYKAALATMLFKVESERRFPVHRHIAEFLGARYLAQLIDKGLPLQRVLALITGEDGGVVTEMRGLSAWLAAQCQSARIELIERDPIGVGLYGDLHQFSHDEKRALLNALEHVGKQLGPDIESQYWIAAFGPLTTPDMEPVLREILTDTARDEQHQMLVVFVLRILEEGPRLPKLLTLLLDIVRDDAWWPRIPMSALYAFLHNCSDGQDKTSLLKRLLADIRTRSVTDPEDEILGTLLSQLYPQDLPASQVWNYLSEPSDSSLVGSYILFWYHDLLEKSSDEDVSELLDGLQCSPPGLWSALEMTGPLLEDFPLKLLARGLKAHGDKITTERLYDWLDVGAPAVQYGAGENVRTWLEQRPTIKKAILTEGVRRYAESDEENFNVYMYEVEQRLYGANFLPDLGPWCVQQAMAATNSQAVEYFIALASRMGLSLETQLEQAYGHKKLQNRISEMITQREQEKIKIRELRREDQSYMKERERKENERLAYVRSNEAALRENRAAPALLFRMAQEYFGRFYRSNNYEGPQALERQLQGDQSLVNAALHGLRGVIDREDVPEAEEIISLRAKGKIHYLGWPFLAGLAELERTAQEDSSCWDDKRIRRAVAFYYCTPHGGYRPEWYCRLLEARPQLVADIQIQFAVSEFRSDFEHIYELHELAHSPAHAQVARLVSLTLLRAFPTRCKLKQLRELDNLLWTAIQYADRASLEEVIATKLSRKSMNPAPRAHWLTAGLVVSPAIYRERLSDFIRDHEKQVQQVATFFCDSKRQSHSELEISTVKLLIRLIGSYVGPDLRWKEGFVSPAMEASRQVDTYIRHLATSPAQDASDALASLYADPVLERWHGELSRAQDSQRVIRRDAEYRHPTIEQVCETLNDGTPANPGDLAALLVDRLREIAMRIRTGNTDDWRQYWNEDSYGRPQETKPENSCRDALLSDLRHCLPPGMDAQPEGQYANDKRADIRVACRDFQVPIEIKKSNHPKLWSAIRTQLSAQYTIDPATGGYGIYLVFWFGLKHCRPGPTGLPKSAAELEERLRDTLSPDEARMISVCVIDVARP